MTGSPQLEVVIVSYGRSDLLAASLRSVIRFAPPDTRINVVDNASPDDTPERIEADFPDVNLIRRTSNDGFSVANNEILRSVQTPYVLLLNPDAELIEGTLDHLLREMETNADIGVLGCRLTTADGGLDHAAKRSIPTPYEALKFFALRAIGRSGSTYTAPELAPDGVGDVDAINGAFMLVRTSAMREVGLLDETFWMYAEDLDWCVRFRARGWRVVYDGSVAARHMKAGTSGKIRPVRLNFHFHRSMAIFYRRYFAGDPAAVRAVVLAGIWARFALYAAVRGVTRAAQMASSGSTSRSSHG